MSAHQALAPEDHDQDGEDGDGDLAEAIERDAAYDEHGFGATQNLLQQ